VKRRLGAVRQPGREGLTKAQAERELRRRIDSDAPVANVWPRTGGERYLHHLEHVLGIQGQKPPASRPAKRSARRRGLADTTAIEVKGRTYGVTLNRNVAGQWHGYAKRSMMPDASVGGLPTRIKCLDALRSKLGGEEPCLGD
jgi:hypothetical protein